jgi:hypothetical protein
MSVGLGTPWWMPRAAMGTTLFAWPGLWGAAGQFMHLMFRCVQVAGWATVT